MAPPSVVETYLNAGAHLQTFPYPTKPRSLPSSNAFMAKWRSQTSKFLIPHLHQQKRDKQKNYFALPPGGVGCQSPTKLCMVIEEVLTILAPLKHVHL